VAMSALTEGTIIVEASEAPSTGSVQFLSHFRFGLSGGRTGLRR
jgi:hypothetical protein